MTTWPLILCLVFITSLEGDNSCLFIFILCLGYPREYHAPTNIKNNDWCQRCKRKQNQSCGLACLFTCDNALSVSTLTWCGSCKGRNITTSPAFLHSNSLASRSRVAVISYKLLSIYSLLWPMETSWVLRFHILGILKTER